ncbi:MAG TPA: hypothetical protein VL625_00100 [Patescibacteria group bacterium]|jgi:hypothetical protein|nr:hypothetical protein [Patescibacteria group bacterium]
MSSEIPGIRKLARDGVQFVRANRAYVIDYARPTLVPILAAGAFATIGLYMSQRQSFGESRSLITHAVLLVTSLISLYGKACFVMAWHRASLLGPKREHRVNPFGLKQGEGRFFGVFLGISLLGVLAGILAGGLIVVVQIKTSSLFASLISGLVAIIVGYTLTLRCAFLLPARSVGADMSWGEAQRTSKGLMWNWVAAVFIADFWLMCLVLSITAAIYALLFATGLAHLADDHALVVTGPGCLLLYLFGTIPCALISFVMIARGITILSWLYQWSVQNRAQ